MNPESRGAGLCPHGNMPASCKECQGPATPEGAVPDYRDAGKDIDVAAVRQAVDAERCFPAKVIEGLKKDAFLAEQFAGDTGVVEKYDLERHVTMVMVQFERYFARKPLPGGVDRGFFRSLLALHDIGKPASVKEARKGVLQHDHNVPIARTVLERLGYSPREVGIATALLADDPIGRFMKPRQKDPERWAARVVELAGRSGLSVPEYYGLLKTLFLVDAGAYTSDAGGKGTLDPLFEFDRTGGEMDLAPEAADTLFELEEAIEDAARQARIDNPP